jgi:hypothetical protein
MSPLLPGKMGQRSQRDGSEEQTLADAAVSQKSRPHIHHHPAVPPLHRPRLPGCAMRACSGHGTLCRMGIPSRNTSRHLPSPPGGSARGPHTRSVHHRQNPLAQGRRAPCWEPLVLAREQEPCPPRVIEWWHAGRKSAGRRGTSRSARLRVGSRWAIHDGYP